MNLLTTTFKFFNLLGGFSVVGALLAMAFLLINKEGFLTTSGEKLRGFLRISALIWVIGAFGTIIFTLAQILGTTFSDALDLTVIRSFLTQISLGKYLAVQALMATVVLIFSFVTKRVESLIILLVLSIAGLVAPVFESHSASSGSHSLVIGSLVVHVIALSLWVGGVIALAFLSANDRPVAVPRFSQLALWSAIAVVISGAVNAWARLNFVDAWNSAYAFIVLGKIVATIVLVFIGYLHRKTLAKKDSINWVGFAKLLTAEALIMVVTVLMGTWLSTSASPDRPGSSEFSPALSIVGVETPPPPTLSRILFSYEPNALMIGILTLMVALYVKGVVVLTKRGDKWPVGRTVAFALGITATDFATSGGLGLYAQFSFSYHMISHMVLGMVAPIGFVLSAPITLALRTLPIGRTSDERGIRGNLIALLHSKYFQVVSNPIVALAIFDGSLFALYMTPLFGDLMQSHFGHLFMSLHFLLAGTLFFHVIVGIDPSPKRVPYIVRIIILFAAMSIHAFFSIALMSASTLLDGGYFASLDRPWSIDLLADQKAGGAVGWAMGEIPILIALVATFIQWTRDDKKETKRIDRAEDRAAAMGEDDELAKYNKYLAGLRRLDETKES